MNNQLIQEAIASTAPASDYQSVTPSDTTDLPGGVCRTLIISGAGTLVIDNPSGVTRTLTVPAGVFPGRVRRVHATGTTATGITALY